MYALLQRLRTDFQLTIISSFGACALLGILPFAVYRFVSGKRPRGFGRSRHRGSASWSRSRMRGRNEDRRRASLFLAMINSVGCLISATILGPPGLYWMYPALLGNYLLLSRGSATLVTASAMLFLAVQGKAYDSTMQLVMFLVSASTASLVAFVFAYRTETQREQLELLATLDPLTGAHNRRAMERELQVAMELHRRDGATFGLAMLDLDHFKSINDRHGHETGDEVLVDFADLIRRSTRKVDRCFRFGGEEFVLLMPATDAEALRVIDQHLRARVAEQLQCRGEQVTVSIGAAALRPGEHWQDWLARADAALYRAKNEGRNRTIVDAG